MCCVVLWTRLSCSLGVLCDVMNPVVLWSRCVVWSYGPSSVVVKVCCVMLWTWFCCGPGVLCDVMDLVLLRSRCVV